MATEELRQNMKATARARNVQELAEGRRNRGGYHRDHSRYNRRVKHQNRRDW